MSPTESRTVKPGALLSQWWTLGAVLADRRTTGRHGAVAWVIIDRYMQKHGSGRASLRYIEKAAGVSRHTVIKACRELVEWGYFDQHVGIGTRPTEYSPKWLVVHPSTPLASGEPLCTTGGEPVCTTSDSSGVPMCTESYLREPADRPASQVIRNENTPAPATPPLTAGLSAADADGARDPFDRFWQKYPRKYQKPKARAAWGKLAPNEELAERIIEASGRWADHYQAHPIDKKWMPTPANWLTGERYDEDLPAVYIDVKEAAIAKVKDRPTKTKPTVPETFRPLREVLTITGSKVTREGHGKTSVRFDTINEAGETSYIYLDLESTSKTAQDRDQARFASLLRAVDLAEVDDSSQLHGKRFVRVLRSKFADYEFEPLQANDNQIDEAA